MQDLENQVELTDQDENKAIAAILAKILDERQSQAKEMEKQASTLEKRANQAEKLEQAAGLLSGFSEYDRHILFGSEEGSIAFTSCIELARDYRAKLLAAAQEYRALGVRFRRSTVNLGVIGTRGAGKSRLLQSLSGLNNDFIPSSDGPSCTGVTCVIENAPGQTQPEVRFTLKDEKTVEREINQELKDRWREITDSQDGAPQLAEGISWKDSLQDAFDKMGQELERRRMSSGTAYTNWKTDKNIYYEQYDEWHPLVFPAKPQRIGPDQSEILDSQWSALLSQWQEQMTRWAENIKAPLELEPGWVKDDAPRCRLTNLNVVSQYVSKRSAAGSDSRDVYQYHPYHIGIREAHIRIAFKGIQAHICLIDTVGIGDNSSDTPDRMKRAIDVNSDGLIFLHRYPASGCDTHDPSETPELNDLAKICGDRAAARPGDWVAFLMNVVPKPDCSDEWIADYFDPYITHNNLELPDTARNPETIRASAASLEHYANGLTGNAMSIGLFSGNSPDQNGRAIRLRRIADVNKSDAVKNFLNQFLRQISERLHAIDNAKKSGAENRLKLAEEAEERLDRALHVISIPDNNRLNAIRIHMSGKLKNLREKLIQFYAAVQKEKELESPLKTCHDNIQRLYGDKKELQKVVSDINNNLGQPRTLLNASEYLYQKIRLMARDSSSAYEKWERTFKDKLSEMFLNTLGIDLAKLDDENEKREPLRKSDERYFEDMGKLLFRETSGTKDLLEFFQSVQRFHLNDSSVMAEAIVCHAAAKNLSVNTVQELMSAGSIEKTRTDAAETGTARAEGHRHRHDTASAVKTSGQSKSTDDTPGGLLDTEEIIDILHRQMTNLLNDINNSLKVEETYSIPPQERLREEILNFNLCFGEPYEAVWLCVFDRLYKKGAILQDEKDALHRIHNTGDQIRQRISEYRGGTPAN